MHAVTTSEDIAKEAGDPIRQVQFGCAQTYAWLRRTLPGMEDWQARGELVYHQSHAGLGTHVGRRGADLLTEKAGARQVVHQGAP